MAMRETFAKSVSLLLLSAVGCLSYAQAQVTVAKQASEANPTLCVASFEGSQEMQRRFMQVLQRCDWFAVVNSQGEAEYVVRCRETSGAQPALEVEITPRAGNAVAFRQPLSADGRDRCVFQAVDSLVYAVFRTPGPCTSKIAFAVGGDGCKEIFTCNFDGTDARQLTHNQSISTEPSWGAGGASMVYTLYESNATSVVVIDVRQQRQRRLSWFPGLNAGADLSPDGRRATLCLSRDQRVELYVMDVASGRLTRLTDDVAVESSPCWSPDGSQICYVSDKSGRPQLYVIPAKGGRAVRLLSDRAESVSPDWSSASNRICFSTRMGAAYALAVIDMGGARREKTVVTRAAGDWEAPSWSPDGRHVVCSRRLDDRRGLCMVDTWYGRILPITKSADHSLPSWSDRF